MTEHEQKLAGKSPDAANSLGNSEIIQAIITGWIVPVLVKRFLSTVGPAGDLKHRSNGSR